MLQSSFKSNKSTCRMLFQRGEFAVLNLNEYSMFEEGYCSFCSYTFLVKPKNQKVYRRKDKIITK